MRTLEQQIKEHARAIGFDLVGIAPASDSDGFAQLTEWLNQGHDGEMAYMRKHAEARRHPRSILPDVRSVIMVALNYKPAEDVPASPDLHKLLGQVSCYARGTDYHEVMRDKLKTLLLAVQAIRPGTRGRGVVDTAPLLERDFARRAGLGWFGKNTMLINKKLGSWFFLGGLLLDVELASDTPFTATHCGSCSRCLDACPTQAFTAPYQLDARLCISYLTIELRGSIAEELREPMGDWVFGCDICQDVCPWNTKAPVGRDERLQEERAGAFVDLLSVMSLTEAEFQARFADTPLLRTGRAGLLRNCAIALGNIGDASAIAGLERACDDADAIVGESAAWALHRIRQRLSLCNVQGARL
ncbi:MAG: tRNA epoxyqueuosine(34) reductase QueG [Gemmataceae bacterium]|nr:tRNA epoxyqueuosine(34) reductase QueG [Gemmataceae bacterium]